MATPHARPVAYSDILLYSFYQSVDEVGDVYIIRYKFIENRDFVCFRLCVRLHVWLCVCVCAYVVCVRVIRMRVWCMCTCVRVWCLCIYIY